MGIVFVTCSVGKRKYFCKIVTKVPYVLSHKFTVLDYSKESVHGTLGTINYL